MEYALQVWDEVPWWAKWLAKIRGIRDRILTWLSKHPDIAVATGISLVGIILDIVLAGGTASLTVVPIVMNMKRK